MEAISRFAIEPEVGERGISSPASLGDGLGVAVEAEKLFYLKYVTKYILDSKFQILVR